MIKNKLVYLHRKATDGTVFYVGIGSEKRSLCKNGRSSWWYNTVDKHGYYVDIVERGLSWEEACDSEIALIDLIGRKDLGLGSLVNLTDGGEGGLGHISGKRVGLIDMNTGRTFESMYDASVFFNLHQNDIGRFLDENKGYWSKSKVVDAGAGSLRRILPNGCVEYIDRLDKSLSIEGDCMDYISDIGNFKDIPYVEYTGGRNEDEGEVFDDVVDWIYSLDSWWDRQIFLSYMQSGLSMKELSDELSISKTVIFTVTKKLKKELNKLYEKRYKEAVQR